MIYLVLLNAPEIPVFQLLLIIISLQLFLYYYRALLIEIVQNMLTKEQLRKTNKFCIIWGISTLIVAIIYLFLFVYSVAINFWFLPIYSVGLLTFFWFIAFFELFIVLMLAILVNHFYKKYLNGNITQEIASNQL